MIKDEILKLPSGRNLDALIAEKVMGWQPSILGNYPWQMVEPKGDIAKVKLCPYYSTDIAATWDVVEKMFEFVQTDGDYSDWLFIGGNSKKDWLVVLNELSWTDERIDVHADTFPLAICRAALLLVLDL
jgi:hypothetical protein